MNISNQIRILCAHRNISIAELARRIGCSPQNLNAKLKRESLRISDLEKIAEVTKSTFIRKFVLENGEEI